MAKTQLTIVANDEAQDNLAEICRPAANVTIEGVVTTANKKKVLLVESVQAQQTASVPIVTNAKAKSRLVQIAKDKSAVSVSMSGRVVDGASGSALVLDRVDKVTSLPLIASAKVSQALTKLAQQGSGEISVKAKVKGKGANQVLVLDTGKKK
jgi:hypothetical protein